jgi:1-acyl-sn-glycerol-3-phosphate acyltransferase
MSSRRRSRPSRLPDFARLILRAPIAALFRVQVEGRDLVPESGGLIVAGLPHRTWVEPILLLALLPAGRRVVTVADDRTVNRSWLRRSGVQLVGGAIAVGRRQAGGSGFGDHIQSVEQAIGAGSWLAIYPETGPPTRPPELRRLSAGVAHFAAATQAPVVPIVFGGTGELYLRRRIEVRILSPLSPPPPSPTIAELDAWMARFRQLAQVAANEIEGAASSHEPRRKRWRWLSGNYPRAE